MKHHNLKGVSAGKGKSGRKARAAVKQKLKRRAKKAIPPPNERDWVLLSEIGEPAKRYSVRLVYEDHGLHHAELLDPNGDYYITIVCGYSQSWRAEREAQKVADQLSKGYGAIDL